MPEMISAKIRNASFLAVIRFCEIGFNLSAP